MDFDGGGDWGKTFFNEIKFGENGCEMWAGKGFIGKHLLKQGLCKKLTLIDINKKVLGRNEKNIDKIQSNVWDSVKDKKFDWIVGNPHTLILILTGQEGYKRYVIKT